MHHPRSHTHTAITQTALTALQVHKLDHLTLAQRLRMHLPWSQTRTAITALGAHKVDHLTLAQRFRAALSRSHIRTAITLTAIPAPAVHKGLQETRRARLSSILNDMVYSVYSKTSVAIKDFHLCYKTHKLKNTLSVCHSLY